MKERGFLSILIDLLFSALNRRTVQGSGNVVEEDREVSGFTGVKLAGFGELNIEIGDTESLRIEAEDNLIEHFKTEVHDGTLSIGVQSGINLRPTQPVRFHLKAKMLGTMVLSGSGKIRAQDLETADLSVTISGSGDAAIGTLRAGMLSMRISGSGKVEIAGGQVEKQDITISGSGDYRAGSLSSESIAVTISGSGNAEVQANESLNARVSGSGSVGYHGSPKVVFSGSGSGKVRSLNNA